MDQATLVAQQDALRPFRMFVGGLGGFSTSDNTSVFTDGVSQNTPYGFQVSGGNGFAIEGAGVSIKSGNQGLAISPLVILAGLAYVLLK